MSQTIIRIMSAQDGYIQEGNTFILKYNEKLALDDQTSKGRGRCVFARQQFSRGDIVLEEEPVSFTVFSSYLEFSCSYCGNIPENGRIFGVSSEDPQRYCTEECMRKASDIHALESGAFRGVYALKIEGGMDPCNLVMKLAALRKLAEGAPPASTPTFPLVGRYDILRISSSDY